MKIEVIKIEVIKIEVIKIDVIKIKIIKIKVSGCLARLLLRFRQSKVACVVFKLIVRLGRRVAGWPDQLKIRTTQLN